MGTESDKKQRLIESLNYWILIADDKQIEEMAELINKDLHPELIKKTEELKVAQDLVKKLEKQMAYLETIYTTRSKS